MAMDVMKKVLVLGYARGTKAVVQLLKNEYKVIVSDKMKHEEKIENVSFIEECNINYNLIYEFVVKSPGIPYHHPVMVELLKLDIPIYTEIEIAYRLAKNFKYVAITGTNGKTTTTALTHHIMSMKEETIVAGNIGTALSEFVSDEKKNVVLELSNFQLLGTETFKPHVATIMNLTPDHLDYMLDVEKYYISKTKIYQNQTKNDYYLLNLDDENVMKYCTNIPATIITFSLQKTC